ncbi:MAG: tripartite tricarboxylate transporter permease [archaeon]
MIEILLGVVTGFLIGLVPGLHVNTLLPALSPDYYFIVPLSIAFVFSSFFPSLLLGVPNAETALSVLPGHRLVLRGRAITALLLCFYSAMIASALSLFSLLILFSVVKPLFSSFKPIVPFILAAVILSFVLKNKKAAIIVALSSALGLATFKNEGLLMPILSGFFALSTLMLSFGTSKLTPQSAEFSPKITPMQLVRASLAASLLSCFFSLVPAVSSSIAATAGTALGKMNDEEFMAFVSATNTSYMILSFYTMSVLGIFRSGSAALLSQAPPPNVLQIAGIVLVSSFFAGMLCIALAPVFTRLYRRVNYRQSCVFSIAFIISLNALFTGFYGLLVLFAASAVSVSTRFLNVARVTCMSALMAPIVLL